MSPAENSKPPFGGTIITERWLNEMSRTLIVNWRNRAYVLNLEPTLDVLSTFCSLFVQQLLFVANWRNRAYVLHLDPTLDLVQNFGKEDRSWQPRICIALGPHTQSTPNLLQRDCP